MRPRACSRLHAAVPDDFGMTSLEQPYQMGERTCYSTTRLSTKRPEPQVNTPTDLAGTTSEAWRHKNFFGKKCRRVFVETWTIVFVFSLTSHVGQLYL